MLPEEVAKKELARGLADVLENQGDPPRILINTDDPAVQANDPFGGADRQSQSDTLPGAQAPPAVEKQNPAC
jgi:hypothetical protein